MRLFLAIELPGEVRKAVGALQPRLAARASGWRWARPDGIHLTLRFLGEVDDAADAGLRGTWRGIVASAPPFAVAVGGLGAFPPRGRPRILWVGVREEPDRGQLASLASDLETAARRAGFPPEPRAFRPHLTIARARSDGAVVLPDLHDEGCAGRIAVNEVVLFESHLEPQGARYVALDRFPLAGHDH